MTSRSREKQVYGSQWRLRLGDPSTCEICHSPAIGVTCGKKSCMGELQHRIQKLRWADPFKRKAHSEKLRAVRRMTA